MANKARRGGAGASVCLAVGLGVGGWESRPLSRFILAVAAIFVAREPRVRGHLPRRLRGSSLGGVKLIATGTPLDSGVGPGDLARPGVAGPAAHEGNLEAVR